MQYYFAPLEGITDAVFRRIHHTYFPGLHRYYTPFFSPTVHRALTPREARELPPAHSLDVTVVPQLLTRVPEDFLWMARQCRDLGYTEVNLNVGCPSGTVTAKGKGAGMLQNLDSLDAFLEAIFAESPLPISVKTRIGFESPAEFPALLDVYNRYPIRELTVHPRVRSAFYQGSVDRDAFDFCMRNSKNPVCYNGDITSIAQLDVLQHQYPTLQAVMLGRGLVGDPGLLSDGTTGRQLEGYMNALTQEYLRTFGNARNTMFRLKEHWAYLAPRFSPSDKLTKQLRKTTDLSEYQAITAQIYRSMP